jgi:hypothetical protein
MNGVAHDPEQIQRLIHNVIDLDIALEEHRRNIVESVTAFRDTHALRRTVIDELTQIVDRYRGDGQ